MLNKKKHKRVYMNHTKFKNQKEYTDRKLNSGYLCMWDRLGTGRVHQGTSWSDENVLFLDWKLGLYQYIHLTKQIKSEDRYFEILSTG